MILRENASKAGLVNFGSNQSRSYAFIIGNYGTGKSQLKNMIIESINREFDNRRA